MPSFLEQFKSLLQLPLQTGKKLLSQSRAKGLQVKAAPQLPAVEEQVDISETVTPIAPATPLAPTGVGTTPTAGGQVGVPTQPLPPGGVTQVSPDAGLGGISEEQITQFRELIGQQRTPEMIEEETQTRQILEQLIPFRQQLIESQAPSEAITQLDTQIGEMQRQIERTRPEALVGRAETLAGAGLEARARRAPVQTELTELLFQRSALGQRRAAQAQRAQAGITALGAEATIRQAMAQLGRPAELPAGIQTEIFKRAFPTAPEPTLRTVGNQLLELIPGQPPKVIFEADPNLDPLTRQQIIGNTMSLRKDFNSQSKEFIKVRDAYGRIKASATDPSAAGDLALIFNYMKVLDPGSTVREGEFATAQNSGSVPDRIRAQYNNIIEGTRLSQNQRDDFVDRAGKLYKSQRNFQNTLRKEFSTTAQSFGLDPLTVAPDVTKGIEIIGEESIEIERGGGSFRRNEDGSYTRVK
jgi:hypothetical protein